MADDSKAQPRHGRHMVVVVVVVIRDPSELDVEPAWSRPTIKHSTILSSAVNFCMGTGKSGPT
jgi:hypothetical protein